ncbi:MAG: hypothetical protein KGJ78_02840 [Alphaproteobacteria bacterium]|nr:hypothetical protein [Alphaproteobacteria bacterium]
MRKSTIAIIVMLGIPVVTMTWFMLTGATIALVRNEGTQDTTVSMTIDDHGTIERTPEKPIAAGGAAFIVFFPRTTGDLSVTCWTDRGWKGFAVGSDGPDKFIASEIAIASCDRLIGHAGIAL